jgi:hypothetical protein
MTKINKKNFFKGMIINILHKIFIIYMLVGWMTDDIYKLILYTCTLITLKVHWKANNDTCGLTILEQVLTGVKKNESFINQIVNPVYKIKDETTKKISHYYTNIMMIVIIYRLTKHKDLPGLMGAMKNLEFRKILSRDIQ